MTILDKKDIKKSIEAIPTKPLSMTPGQEPNRSTAGPKDQQELVSASFFPTKEQSIGYYAASKKAAELHESQEGLHWHLTAAAKEVFKHLPTVPIH